MTTKSSDRRKAFWASFVYICLSPVMVYIGADITIVQSTVMALMGLGVANYFSKPSEG